MGKEEKVKAELSEAPTSQMYPPSKIRREIECYKQIYKQGLAKKVQPICLYDILKDAFAAASHGYQINKADGLPTDEFKTEAENFAKTAAKFEKILGTNVVTHGRPDFWIR